MSELRTQENAIVFASVQQLITLGTTAAQRLLAGKESKKQTRQGLDIIRLFHAYNCKADLTDVQIDALLSCLKYLSDATYFPSTSPIAGQPLEVVEINTQIVSPLDGVMIDIGTWDMSANLFPSTGGSGTGGAIKKGNLWNIIGAGSPSGRFIDVGATIFAKVDNPGQNLSNWRIFD